jgi:hypothetical protein
MLSDAIDLVFAADFKKGRAASRQSLDVFDRSCGYGCLPPTITTPSSPFTTITT